MRLFFAVELPRALRDKVEHVQSLLRAADADVRWIRPDGAHFTLTFLGDVDPDEITAIDAAASAVAARGAPLRLRLAGLGAFASRGRLRVVWISVRGPNLERLESIQADLAAGLSTCGFEPDRRRYRPHMTLGRVRRSRHTARLAALIERHEHIELGDFAVGRLVLMESRLGPDGARYEIVGRYPLGG